MLLSEKVLHCAWLVISSLETLCGSRGDKNITTCEHTLLEDWLRFMLACLAPMASVNIL